MSILLTQRSLLRFFLLKLVDICAICHGLVSLNCQMWCGWKNTCRVHLSSGLQHTIWQQRNWILGKPFVSSWHLPCGQNSHQQLINIQIVHRVQLWKKTPVKSKGKRMSLQPFSHGPLVYQSQLSITSLLVIRDEQRRTRRKERFQSPSCLQSAKS